MQIQPYLFFEGRCDEAIQFYQRALGASVTMVMRYRESPEPVSGVDPEKVMHAEVRIGETTLFVSDGHCAEPASFKGFSLSLSVPDPSRAQQLFDALADGGQIRMPLTKTFFSPSFGMVSDRFGVLWMVIVESPHRQS